MNIIIHINRLKEKNHLAVSKDAEKAFCKIQHAFMIKVLKRIGSWGIYLNIINAMYDKPTANIILHGEKLKAILFKIRNETGLSTVPTLFQ